MVDNRFKLMGNAFLSAVTRKNVAMSPEDMEDGTFKMIQNITDTALEQYSAGKKTAISFMLKATQYHTYIDEDGPLPFEIREKAWERYLGVLTPEKTEQLAHMLEEYDLLPEGHVLEKFPRFGDDFFFHQMLDNATRIIAVYRNGTIDDVAKFIDTRQFYSFVNGHKKADHAGEINQTWDKVFAQLPAEDLALFAKITQELAQQVAPRAVQAYNTGLLIEAAGKIPPPALRNKTGLNVPSSDWTLPVDESIKVMDENSISAKSVPDEIKEAASFLIKSSDDLKALENMGHLWIARASKPYMERVYNGHGLDISAQKLNNDLIKKTYRDVLNTLTKKQIRTLIENIDKSGVMQSLEDVIGETLFPVEFIREVRRYNKEAVQVSEQEQKSNHSPIQQINTKITEIKKQSLQEFRKSIDLILQYDGGKPSPELETEIQDFILFASKRRLSTQIVMGDKDIGDISDNRIDNKRYFNSLTKTETEKLVYQLFRLKVLQDLRDSIDSGDSILPSHLRSMIRNFDPVKLSVDEITNSYRAVSKNGFDANNIGHNNFREMIYTGHSRKLFSPFFSNDGIISGERDPDLIEQYEENTKLYLKRFYDGLTPKEKHDLLSLFKDMDILDKIATDIKEGQSLFPKELQKRIVEYATPAPVVTAPVNPMRKMLDEIAAMSSEDRLLDFRRRIVMILNHDGGKKGLGLSADLAILLETSSKSRLSNLHTFGKEDHEAIAFFTEYARRNFASLSKYETEKVIFQLHRLNVLADLKKMVKEDDCILPIHVRNMIKNFDPINMGLKDSLRAYRQVLEEGLDPNDPLYKGIQKVFGEPRSGKFIYDAIEDGRVSYHDPVEFNNSTREFFKRFLDALSPSEKNAFIPMLDKMGLAEGYLETIENGDCLLPDEWQKKIVEYATPAPVVTAPVEEVQPEAEPEIEETAETPGEIAEIVSETVAVETQLEEEPVVEVKQPAEIMEVESEVAAEAVILSEELRPDYIQVIPVESLIRETDDPTDIIGGITPRERSDEEKSIVVQPRLEWLLKGLEHDGFRRSDMIIYREKQVDGMNDEKSPYVVLEIMDKTRHLQIALCQVKGNSTYIIRDPIDFEKQGEVTTSELRHRADVFKISCYSPEQWMRSIRTYGYSPLEELGEQLKTRIGWADKAKAVVESFGDFYLEHGRYPSPGDTSIIEHGPEYDPMTSPHTLKGRTTWRRLYQALQSGSIGGMQDVRNFEQLKCRVFGVESTGQAPKVEPPPELNAREVFKAIASHLLNTSASNFNTLEIQGNKESKISLAFRMGTVREIEELVPNETQAITSLEDFALATGLISRSGITLVPASEALLNILVRSI